MKFISIFLNIFYVFNIFYGLKRIFFTIFFKMFLLFLVPRIFIIHLKRFDNFQRKIKKFVRYENKINLTKFSNGKDKNEEYEYRLFSVLIHEGFSINSGHYFCHVKNSDNAWYTMNDSWVSRTNDKNILQQTPYLLFYERIMKKQNNINLEQPKNTLIKEASISMSMAKPKFSDNEQLQSIIKLPTLSNSDKFVNNDEIQDHSKNKFSSSQSQHCDVPISSEIVPVSQPFSKNSNSKSFGLMENILQTDTHSAINESIKTNSFSNEICNGVVISQTDKSENNNFSFISRKRRKLKQILKNLQNTRGSNEHLSSAACLDDFEIPSFLPSKNNIPEKNNDYCSNPILNNINETPDNFKKDSSQVIIHNRNLTNLYGSDKIELWDTEDDSDLLKKQISFIKSVHDFKEKTILEKDEYDVNYDMGKLKKIKKEKYKSNSNVFQKVHDKYKSK